jgi:D-glycero-alpha-D-manno-heptose 1-phosphate guanylyltransferase
LAIVLAGGLGTRLKKVLPDLPKPLAPVAGKPFLEWVLHYLRGQGIERVVLSAGHHAEKVAAFAKALDVEGMQVAVAVEREPLGTAGGFLNALHSEHSESDVLVCNGDSLVLADLKTLFQSVKKADAAILGVRVEDASRFGTLKRSADGQLLGFEEKRPGAGVVNGGVYLFRRDAVARFPHKRPLSFEYDVFPALIAEGAALRAVSCDAPFLDIGTEASLAEAGDFIRQNMEWFE